MCIRDSIMAVLCIASIVILNLKKINTALYSLSTAIWLGSAVVFIPAVMFAVYNLPKRISMAQSPMKMFIDATIYGAQGAILWVFGLFFVLACIGLAVSIFLSVKKRRKNDVSDNKKETA